MADFFEEMGVEYVEGYLNMNGLPIEHAFNVIDGKYFDITMELALKKHFDRERTDTYVSIGTFSVNEVRKKYDSESLLQSEITVYINKVNKYIPVNSMNPINP